MTPLDDVLNRLRASLDVLEAAVLRRKANDEIVMQLEDDVHLLAVDRAKLAAECDDLKAQANGLARANTLATRRIDHVVETLREFLTEEGA